MNFLPWLLSCSFTFVKCLTRPWRWHWELPISKFDRTHPILCIYVQLPLKPSSGWPLPIHYFLLNLIRFLNSRVSIYRTFIQLGQFNHLMDILVLDLVVLLEKHLVLLTVGGWTRRCWRIPHCSWASLNLYLILLVHLIAHIVLHEVSILVATCCTEIY